MGMTYTCYAIPKGSVDFKKHLNDYCIDYLLEDVYTQGIELIDDMTYDREALGTWMGLTDTEWNSLYEHGYCFITTEHIQKAIKTLQNLNERIHSMPFKNSGRNCMIMHCDGKTPNPPSTWDGPEENYAIYQEVMKVFLRDYHFSWPWDTPYRKGKKDWGCQGYIEDLQKSLNDTEDTLTSPDFPDGVDIVLFYY